MNDDRLKIAGEGFILRNWRPEDRESLAQNANNIRVWNNLRDEFPHPYTLQDADEFIALANERHRDQYLAVEVEGRAVGGIGITPGASIERLTAEIGYWLGEPYWGRGIMPSAVRAFAKHLFRTTDFIRLWAGIYDYNRPSQRVLEKAGFTHLCTLRKAAVKNRRIIDLEYYELIKPCI